MRVTPDQLMTLEHVLGNKLTILGLGLSTIRQHRAVDRERLDGMIEAADAVSESLVKLRADMEGRR